MTDQHPTEPAYKYVLPRFNLQARIQKLVCIKETKAFVTLIDRFNFEDRRKKSNLIHDTWESAHAELTRLVLSEINAMQRRLMYLQKTADAIKDMQPPTHQDNQ